MTMIWSPGNSQKRKQEVYASSAMKVGTEIDRYIDRHILKYT